MPKHLYVLLALTFLAGLASGLYVYFITREPEEFPASESLEGTGFEIVATIYGGCERIGCSSIRLLDDGSYTYLLGGVDDEYERFEDRLSSQQTEVLTELMEETPFDAIENTIFEGTCPVAYDGPAYRFAIRLEATQYDFDSCSESLEGVPLFEELIGYFDIMDATYRMQ